MVLVRVLQLPENRVVLVHVHDGDFREFPAQDREEAGREDLAVMRDEHDPASVGDPERGAAAVGAPIHSRREFRLAARRGVGRACERVSALLQHEPAVKRRFGRLHAVRLRLRVGPKPLEHPAVLFRLDALFLDAASDRDEEKDAPHRDPTALEQVGDLVDLAEIPLRDRRIDLNGKIQLGGKLEHFHRLGETTLEAPKCVVRGGVGSVEADPDGGDAGVFGLPECFERRQRRGGRGQRRHDPFGNRVFQKLKNVLALERVAAREAHIRLARERGDLVDELDRLFVRQFVRSGLMLRAGPAVFALQIARPGHFVVKHQGVDPKIVGGVRLHWHNSIKKSIRRAGALAGQVRR